MDDKRFQSEVRRILAEVADPAFSDLFRRIADYVAESIASGKSAGEAIDEAIVTAGLADGVGSVVRRSMLQEIGRAHV